MNIKSKRKRTLIRKAIEVSKLCNLQILIVIKDEESHKLIEYNSGDLAKGIDHFGLEQAIALKKASNLQHVFYDDLAYSDLTPNSKRAASEIPEEEIANLIKPVQSS